MYRVKIKENERITLSHNNYSVTLTLKSNPSQAVLKYFYDAGFECIEKIEDKPENTENNGDTREKTRKSKDI